MWFDGFKNIKTSVFLVKFHTIAKCFEKREYFISRLFFLKTIKRVNFLGHVARFFFFGYYYR
jgi:hypothetical protein